MSSGVYNFIISSFYVILLVDDINGFLMEKGVALPVSIFFKTMLSVIIAINICRHKVGQILIVASILYVSVLFLAHSFIVETEFGETINHLYRFIFTTYVYAFLYYALSKQGLFDQLKRILEFNTVVLVINILLILIGLGHRNYIDGGEMTSKGFFYAGNELSGLFILLCPIYLYFISVKSKSNSLKFWGTFLVITIATILLGSKTGIAATFFLNSVVIYHFLKKHKKKNYFYVGILVILLTVSIKGMQLVEEWDMWQRWSYFYDKGGLAQVFFSNRDVYWEEEKSVILSNSWIYILMGLGGNRTVEMDIHDTFLNYGIIGLFFVYSFYAIIIYRVYKFRRKEYLANLIFYIDIVFLLSSSLAGHMIFSGMAASFIAMVNILPLAKVQKLNKNENYI